MISFYSSVELQRFCFSTSSPTVVSKSQFVCTDHLASSSLKIYHLSSLVTAERSFASYKKGDAGDLLVVLVIHIYIQVPITSLCHLATPRNLTKVSQNFFVFD